MLQQPRSQEEAQCTRTQEVSWETLLNKGGKTSQILFYIFKINTFTTKKTYHTRGFLNPRRLEPKRGAQFSQEGVLAEISKLAQKI
jgi:hypothetical protein